LVALGKSSMSQDNQNSQPPSSPEPEANQSEPQVEQANQPPQRRSQRVQPAWKSAIIGILRGTIGVLEATVEKLEAVPPPGTVETPPSPSSRGWGAVLGKIRSFLPANLSAKVSDTALTGIIVGIAVVLVWTTSTVFASKPTEVATVPSTEEAPPATIATPPEQAPPVPPIEETPPPVAEEISPPTVEETPPPVTEEAPPPVVEETPPPVAEEVPPPTVEETPPSEPEPEPTPTPPPTIVLTPEQTLIATIENQVAEVSDRFALGLIKSLKANFRSSNLTVVISEEWYNLEPNQQDKLAAEMWQRSKDLDFSHIDIIDPQGRLVARNPVVGDEMIIFQPGA
jgi:hypothetical protein